MSQYNASATRLREAAAVRRALQQRAAREAAQRAADDLEQVQSALLEGVGSRIVRDIGERVPPLGADAATLEGFRTTIAGLGPVDMLRGAMQAPTLAAMRTELAVVGARLAQAERFVVADAVESTLRASWDTVQRFDAEGASGFEARRGHEVVVVGVEDGGSLSSDFPSSPDCAASERELTEGVRAAGVDLTPTVHVPHDPDDGGSLVLAARRTGAGSLAEGVARHLGAAGFWDSNPVAATAERVRS